MVAWPDWLAGLSSISKNDLDESYKVWLERVSVEKNYRITS